jgi:hypothetical protein
MKEISNLMSYRDSIKVVDATMRDGGLVNDFYFDDDDDKGFGEILRRHISIGADIYPTEHLYIALGCNLRKRAEMSVNGSRGFTGMTIGTGLRLGRVMFDISYGKYQVSESSLICNFGFNI